MVLYSLLLLGLLLQISGGELLWKPDVVYHAKGTIKLPYADIVEPFEAWYDGKNMRSRQTYYNGMLHIEITSLVRVSTTLEHGNYIMVLHAEFDYRELLNFTSSVWLVCSI